MKPACFDRPGAWSSLFASAMTLIDRLSTVVTLPVWSFGGGTVLMLRLNHRMSKDIDLFVPDPQYLGHLSPRLAEAAEQLTTDYQESAEAIKLYLAEGEIDIVVGTPLTDAPWDLVVHEGRGVRVESCAEIVAKKMHYRGRHGRARDLFDLCAVAEFEPAAIEVAHPYIRPHLASFLEGLHARRELAREEFDQIDRIAYRRDFDACLARAERLLD